MAYMAKLSQQEPFTSSGADAPDKRSRELRNFRIYQKIILRYSNNQLEFD